MVSENCWNCDKPLVKGANFCKFCGSPVRKTPTGKPAFSEPLLSEEPKYVPTVSGRVEPSPVEEDVPEEIVNKEKKIYRGQALEMGKPEKIVDKIAEGKMEKFFKESCLLSQSYVRDPDLTIADLLNETIAKIGENISIKRFVRFQLGES